STFARVLDKLRSVRATQPNVLPPGGQPGQPGQGGVQPLPQGAAPAPSPAPQGAGAQAQPQKQ
ncbi:MAG TPA: hypothetical protein VNP72_10900, partial [Longimicrobium sp.]|nr:hypothetical protein [Longimicrobium sp.]